MQRKHKASPLHFYLTAFNILLPRLAGTTNFAVGVADKPAQPAGCGTAEPGRLRLQAGPGREWRHRRSQAHPSCRRRVNARRTISCLRYPTARGRRRASRSSFQSAPYSSEDVQCLANAYLSVLSDFWPNPALKVHEGRLSLPRGAWLSRLTALAQERKVLWE